MPDEPRQDLQHPVSQRSRFAPEELSDELGVGVGGELDPVIDELASQSGVVLQNPVVHHRDLTRDVDLGMGIGLGGGAVGRPAGVTDPGGAVQRLVIGELLEVSQLALGA